MRGFREETESRGERKMNHLYWFLGASQ